MNSQFWPSHGSACRDRRWAIHPATERIRRRERRIAAVRYVGQVIVMGFALVGFMVLILTFGMVLAAMTGIDLGTVR